MSGKIRVSPLSLFILLAMNGRTLSIFVDESGNFKLPDQESRFYIVGMVLHDQSVNISAEIATLERSDCEIGLEGHCFHAGPLIRREKNYSMLSRQLRGRIFSRMMAFARRVDYRYHCLSVDKRYINSTDQIVDRLKVSLAEFISMRREALSSVDHVKIYYDCGQSPVTRLLHQVFETNLGNMVEFATDVKPSRYRLFQVADLICTLHLLELKLAAHIPFSRSEQQFFGGPKKFRHNILRYIKMKEI